MSYHMPSRMENRLRQGDVMSLVIFNFALDCVIRKVPRIELLTLWVGNIIYVYVNDNVIIGKIQKVKKNMMEMIKAKESTGVNKIYDNDKKNKNTERHNYRLQ